MVGSQLRQPAAGTARRDGGKIMRVSQDKFETHHLICMVCGALVI
jgi:hypothetical protein